MAFLLGNLALDRMADTFDEYTSDSCLEIDDSHELLDQLIGLLSEAGRLTHCADHGWWATFRGSCKACEYCDECDCSPCECDEEGEKEEEDL